ncbi:citrate lyase subunit alpha [Ihubacter sp. rT4E-8]|uniref:citrate lyase subunit alpha n=1 Tax=Ihubacter sp. rT4E-8 TaxID=3242369 RepID=UPI003CF5C0FB
MEFVKNGIHREIPAEIEGIGKLRPYQQPGKRREKYLTVCDEAAKGKVAKSLQEAIRKVGLQDGMTISFHHHLRNGDLVLRQVMEAIAELGIRDLTICASSLSTAHGCLVEHMKTGIVTGIETSGMRGELAEAVSKGGILKKPVVFKTHGGRARSIESGERKIDVAFIGASCCDPMGNMNGSVGKSAFGSMGYAMVDARYAEKVVAITDYLVPYPASPISIPQTWVDCVVEVEQIGDPQMISQGATRKTKNPVELTIASYASRVMTAADLVKNGFSYQAGSGGISLAVARYLKEYMKAHQIRGSFASGGITSAMTELLQEGLFEKLLDVQTFDAEAVASIGQNQNHIEMDAEMYADPQAKSNVAHALDIMILSATEVDVHFNVNVLTASNGVIMGALGGHPDTAAGAKLAIVVAPLLRKRVPIIVDRVVTISTPGESVDVVVTERGIAVNPQNPMLKERLMKEGLPVYEIEELRDMAYALTGKPEPPEYGDQVVGLVEYRDGTILDIIRNVR